LINFQAIIQASPLHPGKEAKPIQEAGHLRLRCNMTHYHDVTLTEIDYICNKLFTQDNLHQQLIQCIIHKNYKKSTYDFDTGSCSINIEHDKLLHTKQRNNNNLIRISNEEWEQSCTYTSIHTMFAFLSMVIHTEETDTCPFSNMELCIVCEKEAKNTVFAMINKLEIYFAKITYIDQKELENDSLYLHRFVSEYDSYSDTPCCISSTLHLHLLVLSPIDKNMIPNINKENKSMSYTFLTGLVSATNSETIFPPLTLPPCFTGVIATIVIKTTLVYDTKNMLIKVSKYGSNECICGTNMEYEEDVIHSHYRVDEEYDEDDTYYAPYFQNIGKPMPRSKFLNNAIEDCLGCRVVARIIIDKRQKPKRSHENEGEYDDVIHKLSKIH